LKIVQNFALADHKAKGMRAVLSQLEVAKTVLVVDNGENRNLVLGSRNLEGVTLVETKDVSVYNLLGHAQVLLSETAARKLSEALAK
jgi:large subunit ribosomal protein L4